MPDVAPLQAFGPFRTGTVFLSPLTPQRPEDPPATPGRLVAPAPAGLTAVAGTTGDVIWARFNWSAVARHGIVGYQLEWQLVVGVFPETATINTTTYTANNLAPNADYRVRVRAVTDTNIWGTWSDWVLFTTGADLTRPSVVSSSSVSARAGFRSVTITWSAVTDADVANGNGIYDVQLAPLFGIEAGAAGAFPALIGAAMQSTALPAITAITNTTPIRVTFAAAHGLQNMQRIRITGGVASGLWSITSVTANSVELNYSSARGIPVALGSASIGWTATGGVALVRAAGTGTVIAGRAPVPVAPGDPAAFAFGIVASSVRQAVARLEFLNSSGGVLAVMDGDPVSINVTTPGRAWVGGAAPAGAASVRASVVVFSAVAGERFVVDEDSLGVRNRSTAPYPGNGSLLGLGVRAQETSSNITGFSDLESLSPYAVQVRARDASGNSADTWSNPTVFRTWGLSLDDLPNGSITSTMIAPGAIDTPLLRANSIRADMIGAGVIEGRHIAGGTITADLLDADVVIATTVRAEDITTGTFDADFIVANNHMRSLNFDGTFVGSLPVSGGTLGWAIGGDGTAFFNNLALNGNMVASAAGFLQSANYQPGIAGWRIDGNGDAELNNVSVRGAGSGFTRAEMRDGGIFFSASLGAGLPLGLIAGRLQGSSLGAGGITGTMNSLTISDGSVGAEYRLAMPGGFNSNPYISARLTNSQLLFGAWDTSTPNMADMGGANAHYSSASFQVGSGISFGYTFAGVQPDLRVGGQIVAAGAQGQFYALNRNDNSWGYVMYSNASYWRLYSAHPSVAADIVQVSSTGGGTDFRIPGCPGGSVGPYLRMNLTSAQLFYDTSTIKVKENVHGIDDGTAMVLVRMMRPVSFDLRPREGLSDDDRLGHVGFIAEEMAEVFPPGAVYDADRAPASIDDRAVIAALASALQNIDRRLLAAGL